MAKIYRVYESTYLKNPAKWDVRFIGWDHLGRVFAGCYKVNKGKNEN